MGEEKKFICPGENCGEDVTEKVHRACNAVNVPRPFFFEPKVSDKAKSVVISCSKGHRARYSCKDADYTDQ